MIKVLGFTEDFTTCDRCGKAELKGTWAIENSNGFLFRLGSSCIHKKFEMDAEDVKQILNNYKKEEKNKSLYELHISPLKNEMEQRLKDGFTTDYENLTEVAKKIYNSIESEYKRVIELRMKKYKIVGSV